MTKLTFEAWKQAVNHAMEAIYGMSTEDLPDYAYYDAYEDGVNPAVVAKRAMKAAGGF